MKKLTFLLTIALSCKGFSQCPTVTITPVNPTICGAPVTITAAPNGGNAPFTYIWGTGETTQSIIVSTPGNYTVTVSDNNGCSVPRSVFVNQSPPALTPPIAWSNSPVCEGDQLRLEAGNYTGGSYQWTGPNGFTDTSIVALINNVTSSVAGVYSVVVSVGGCPSAPGSTPPVSVIPKPAPPVAGNNGPLCFGQTLNLTATSIAGAIYNWSGSNGFTSTIQNPVINNITDLDSGKYYVTVTVNGCTSAKDSTSVIVKPSTTIPLAFNNGPICSGTTLNLSATSITNATYSWTGPNGYTSTFQNPLISNVTLSNAGTYSVTATVNGCTSVSTGTTDVIIKPIPPTPVPVSNSPVCTGSNLLLNSPFIAGISYSWIGPNGFSSALQNPVINNANLINAGSYTLTLTGCINKVSTTTVIVTPTPSTPTPANNGPLCVGANLTLTTTNIPGAAYNWTGPGGFVSNLQNPFISNIALVNAGMYNLTTSTNACTSAVGNTLVNINDPAIANSGSDQIVCANNSVVNISGTISGGSGTGIWSTNGTGTFSPGNTNLTAGYNLTNADKVAGNITLSLTSTNNGACPVSVSSLLVTIPTAISVNAGNDRAVCTSDIMVGLNGQVMAATGGIWTTTGTGTFSPDNTTLNAAYFPGNADKKNGNVMLVLTSTGNGNCLAVSDAMVIIINPGPSVNAGPDRFVKQNDTVSLQSVVSGLNLKYLWTPNLYLSNDTMPIPVVTGVLDQLYTLQVTDGAGCSNQDDVYVKVLKLPRIPNTFTPNGDGINDVWTIKYLEDYPECRVTVFNRYGQPVFESTGYTKPWDGSYKGKSLPFGTYYYIIEPGNGIKPYTGYITLIK